MGMSIALERESIKAEIYGELLALNAGIIVPVVENQLKE